MLFKRGGLFKRGNFRLKNGQNSCYYFDLKLLTNYRHIIDEVMPLIPRFDDCTIVGVPHGGTLIASEIAKYQNKPLALMRKNAKNHGTGKILEMAQKDDIILIEDVITTGSSIKECIEKLHKENVTIKRIYTLINRSSLTSLNVNGIDYPIYSLYRLRDFDPFPRKFIVWPEFPHPRLKGKRIVFAADTDNLKVIAAILPHVCGVKLHSDIIKKETRNFIFQNFNGFIIEDRKFADIGSVMGKQMLHMKANCVTAYATNTENLRQIGNDILLLHSLSFAKWDPYNHYEKKCLKIARKEPHVVGLIAQRKIEGFVCFQPGISLREKTDNKGQNYITPEEAQGDFLIMGRSLKRWAKKNLLNKSKL